MDLKYAETDDHYTLLAVRPDGIAPVVDLVLAETLDRVKLRALALLDEHASCATVEVWRGGSLLDQVSRF